MKWVLIALPLILMGCQSTDTGVQAARMEAQDDAACKARQDYQQCRKNLFAYRQQAALENQQRQARLDAVADALSEAGKAMQDNEPKTVNVNVSCSFGCR